MEWDAMASGPATHRMETSVLTLYLPGQRQALRLSRSSCQAVATLWRLKGLSPDPAIPSPCTNTHEATVRNCGGLINSSAGRIGRHVQEVSR
jgi:hypothetical protein